MVSGPVRESASLWLAGYEGMQKRMGTTVMGSIGFRVWGLGLRIL